MSFFPGEKWRSGRVVEGWYCKYKVVGSTPCRCSLLNFSIGAEGQMYSNGAILAPHPAASVAQLAGIADIAALHMMFKSISPSISGSRYPKKDTHQASRSLVEMNLHPASAGRRGSKPTGLRSEGSEGHKVRFLHLRSGRRRVSCRSFAERLSHF